MASSSSLAAVLSLCLAVTAVVVSGDTVAAPAAVPSLSSPASVEETCKHTGAQRKLCVEALSADPSSKTADTRGLARLAITLAKEKATETAAHLSSIYDFEDLENKTVAMQQCLEDCEERYEAAVDQLTDAAAALETGAFNESAVLVKAGQAEVKLCQRGCQAVPDHRNILTGRNRSVDRLCSIAMAIVKLIRH